MSLSIGGELAGLPVRGLCALVAVKERQRCKTRLAGVLTAPARLALVRDMLEAVLRAAAASQSVRHVLLISPERDAVPAQIGVLTDTGASLNSALMQAHALLRELGCRETVILPADLPRVTGAQIDALVHAGRPGGFAIAPDSAGVGTNGLYLACPAPFRFQFGPDSRRLHQQEGRRLGLTPCLVRLPGLAFDVDTPADLALLGQKGEPDRGRDAPRSSTRRLRA